MAIPAAVQAPTRVRGPYFYSLMSLAIVAFVIYGFSRTIDAGLLHRVDPAPPVLYVHGVVFSGWVVLFAIQSALVRSRKVAVHRALGIGGAVLGAAIPVVGMATAVAMARVHIGEGSFDEPQFLIVSVYDMTAFLVPFLLALLWRRRAEYHRRLMLIATCTLTVAAFNRFPGVPPNWGFAGVDLLVLAGVARDLAVTGRVHPTYLYGLPAIVAGQAIAMYIYLSAAPLWIRIANALIGPLN
jgi:hypothetical protein